jgi:hypothetical protein
MVIARTQTEIFSAYRAELDSASEVFQCTYMLFVSDNGETTIQSAKLLSEGERAVCRFIVENNRFEISKCLISDALQTADESLFTVVDGENDHDFRFGHSHCLGYWICVAHIECRHRPQQGTCNAASTTTSIHELDTFKAAILRRM